MKNKHLPSDDWRSRPTVYYSMTMGFIQPEWLYMYHFFNDEPEHNTPPNTGTRRAQSEVPSPHPTVRINIRSRHTEETYNHKKERGTPIGFLHD